MCDWDFAPLVRSEQKKEKTEHAQKTAINKKSVVNIFQKNENYPATRPENWKTFPERDFIIECNNSVTHTNLEEIFENSG